MHKHLTLIFATVALSTAAFAQDGYYQIGYAANLNIGDSVLNLSNDGAAAGFLDKNGDGNICVNVYTFDPAEEEIACCACLVTPNGLNALSADADLISNPLTPAIPTSIVVKLVASVPTPTAAGAFTGCNPSTIGVFTGGVPPTGFTVAAGADTKLTATQIASNGLLAWGTTLEPASTPGTYAPVNVNYKNGTLSVSELSALVSTCSFIQSDGSSFGICKSCQTGALAGSKK